MFLPVSVKEWFDDGVFGENGVTIFPVTQGNAFPKGVFHFEELGEFGRLMDFSATR